MEIRDESVERSYKPRATLADYLSTKNKDMPHADVEDFSDLPDDLTARCAEAHGWND